MPNRHALKRTASTAALIAGLTLSALTLTSQPASAWKKVFDPWNYRQNILTAVRSLSEVNQLSPGQMLSEATLMNDIRILDAENRPFLAGVLRVENGKLTMVARSMVKNTSKGAA